VVQDFKIGLDFGDDSESISLYVGIGKRCFETPTSTYL